MPNSSHQLSKRIQGLWGGHTRLGTVDRERQVMVLEVKTDTWEVDDGLDASLLELLGITDTRSLKDQWRRESTAGNNNLLAGTESA